MIHSTLPQDFLVKEQSLFHQILQFFYDGYQIYVGHDCVPEYVVQGPIYVQILNMT